MDNNKASLYITGDTHRHWVERLSYKNFTESKNFDPNKKDSTFVLVAGDFGIWHDSKEQRYNLKFLEEKPFTTLFVDGNHENFCLLNNEFPVEEWNGGKVHRINSSVLHLMRGQVYTIGGKSIFTFGGAASHDIEDGILDPSDPNFQLQKKELMHRGRRYYRILRENYWCTELPSEDEMEEGIANLAKHNNYVDYVISHCAWSSLQSYITKGNEEYQPDILTEYFEKLNETIRYKCWFFGHYHENTGLIQYYGKSVRGLYDDIIKVF